MSFIKASTLIVVMCFMLAGCGDDVASGSSGLDIAGKWDVIEFSYRFEDVANRREGHLERWKYEYTTIVRFEIGPGGAVTSECFGEFGNPCPDERSFSGVMNGDHLEGRWTYTQERCVIFWEATFDRSEAVGTYNIPPGQPCGDGHGTLKMSRPWHLESEPTQVTEQ